jgi:type IV secretion system protein VirD4
VTPTKLLFGTVFSVLAIAVGGVWFATEWAAWHLGFQPQLGAPWFFLFGYPIYPVWALFVWWYAYDAYAPAIFNEAGAIAALSGVARPPD